MPPENAFAFHSTSKFNAEYFWQRYDKAKTEGGVFYFWGHSYELTTRAMWDEFDLKIQRITQDDSAEWTELCSLFE